MLFTFFVCFIIAEFASHLEVSYYLHYTYNLYHLFANNKSFQRLPFTQITHAHSSHT